MRTKFLFQSSVLFVAFALILGFIQAQASLPATPLLATDDGENWFDRAWDYRRPVTISNPCGEEVTNYQIQVILNSSNFTFTNALSDGSDLRVTSSDGITPIPFWIESWDSGGEQASLWIKVPIIPLAGTTVYLYYGNPGPASNLVEVPPIGPWTKAAGNPIIPAGEPGGDGVSLLAENIIYDEATGHYWLVFADYSSVPDDISLAWSNTPQDPGSWIWHGGVITTGNAPHLMKQGDTWYIFYSQWPNIRVATASAVNGPYTVDPDPVLTNVPGTWEAARVDEPYAFQRNDGKWILMYMGDEGSTTELIGYAEADDILGPYTKYSGNPIIDFGPPGSIDAGTVADPWVVEFHGTYYIGYTVSPSKSSPWRTSYVTTNDWGTFTKSNEIILDLGPGGTWDSNNAFRGAVTRIGNTYVFPYTGDSYQMGIATQAVFMPVNQEDTVFPFFDEFDDGIVDTTVKWVLDNGSDTQLSESGGTLTLTGGSGSSYIKIHGDTSFAMGYLVESRARHPQAGTEEMIPEIGMAGASFGDILRIANDFHGTTYWERQVKINSDPDTWINMAQTVDTDWHIFRVYRLSPDVAGFQIDANPTETYISGSGTTTVPTSNLPAFLMSYGNGNQFIVDWIRARKYCGADATATVGMEEPRPLLASLAITKTGNEQVLSGSTVNFDLTVINDGDFGLEDVMVRDALSPDCDRDFASLAIGANQSYACSLAGVTGDFTNTAIVTGTLQAGGTVTKTASAFVDVFHPSIAIAKTPDTQTVIEGMSAVFSIVITNTGDVALQNIVVDDFLVPDCDRVIGSLEALQQTSYTCSYPNTTASFVNTIDLTSDGPLGTSPTATDTANVTVRLLGDAP
ncbi:MAG: DUF2341 domain-containing protein [Chloroflexota bacterium]|nr:DUF2341 domain-containing protein [Chloroflexota bacterium]